MHRLNDEPQNISPEPAETPNSVGSVSAAARSSGCQDFERLITQIQEGDEAAKTKLYEIFSRGLRYFFWRNLRSRGTDPEDLLHDTFVIVFRAIERRTIREPERLAGFVASIARIKVAEWIRRTVAQNKNVALEDVPNLPARDDPEREVLDKEKVALMSRILLKMSRRDRDVLSRFYLHGQSKEQICSDLTLTDTQFRLLKSRAKARFTEAVKRRVSVCK